VGGVVLESPPASVTGCAGLLLLLQAVEADAASASATRDAWGRGKRSMRPGTARRSVAPLQEAFASGLRTGLEKNPAPRVTPDGDAAGRGAGYTAQEESCPMRRTFMVVFACLALPACGAEAPPPVVPPLTTAPPTASTTIEPTAVAAAPAMNPFAQPSTLQYQAPPFDQIRDSDYQPAIEDGMKQQRAEIDAIASLADAPTFDNTIVAMERTGQALHRAENVFSAMTSANTNETLQKVQEALAPELAAHHDAIHLNAALFARIEAVYAQRSTLDPESKFLVERYHTRFVHAGAKLSEADQTALRTLNKEESSLSTEFEKKLLAATKAAALVASDPAELAGLSEGELAAAALAAKDRGLEGKWVLPLQNTTQQPALTHLANRATRERLFKASITRTELSDGNDTRAIALRLSELRAQKAKLLGFPSYAAYVLDDQMAGTPDKAIKLMTDMVPAAVAKARGEAAKMQALADKQATSGKTERFKLAPWDWGYYAEQVRKADYAFDDDQVKPYLELERVLQDGVFFAANKLYGLTFKERKDLPVYQPDVRVFEVFDPDGKSFALFYADYFKRDNKSGGAWMEAFVEQSTLLGTQPVVFNVCNFSKPAPGQPALLSFDDVRTMFHEFGHALHGLSSKVKYPTIAGTSVSRDFVEFPSQFNEHWASEPTVFANFAKHYQTGAPMPADLVAKVKQASKFNQGQATTEYLAAGLLDMAWHTVPDNAAATKPAVDPFEADALKHFKVDFDLVPPRYRTSYFAHIWGGGYAASYYAYLWSEVLDDDAFQWFVEHGGMTRDNGKRFQDMILSRGYTQDLSSMYRTFRGKDPSVQPLLEQRGLVPAKGASAGR
jgi:peptidyl-dipeptidase Dcp